VESSGLAAQSLHSAAKHGSKKIKQAFIIFSHEKEFDIENEFYH
jgi:hypothetical protein